MSEQHRNTSESTARLMIEAETLLSESQDDRELSQMLEEVPKDFVGSLHEEQRIQLDELARLVDATGGEKMAELEALRRNARFEVVESQDRMTLTLATHPAVAGGKPLDVEAVVGELKARGITRGVDVGAIRKAVNLTNEGKELTDATIVQGKPPEPGKPDTYQFFGRRSMDRKPEHVRPERGSGSEEAEQLWLCAEGDLVAKRVPGTPGEPGLNALGEPIAPSDADSQQVQAGQNVKADGDNFVAQVGGLVEFTHDTLEVRKMLVLTEDLTHQDSPIEFDGDVRVMGGVRSGAALKAVGNITVDGPVEDATIESTGGDVHLRHGVAGRKRGRIVAEGNVTTHFAENVTIQAKGDITIDVGAVHSRLTAGGQILLTKGRGQLLGGSAVAGTGIEVRRLGVQSGLATEAVTGVSLETMTALSEVDERVSKAETMRNNCAELADRIKRVVGDPLKLTPEELENYKKLRRMQLGSSLKIRALNAQREEIIRAGAEAGGYGEIRVLNSLMPNVRVSIGSAMLRVSESRSGCVITRDPVQNEIVITGGR